MQILLNTDANIDSREAFATQVTNAVECALNQVSDNITRIEVQLSDVNSNKKGGADDMRCVLEARLKGRKPIAVTHHASTVDQAVDGAAGKLSRLIESTLGRQHDHRGHGHDMPITGEVND